MAVLYCTASDVRAFTQDADMDEAVLNVIIPAVSQAIDNTCHRSFGPAVGSRVYDWTDPYQIRLREDLAALESVTTNAGQTLTPANFTLRPLNGPPYRFIRVKGGTGIALQYTGSKDEAITVTGTWGRLTVPYDIRAACVMWTANLYMTSDVRGLQGLSGDAISAQLNLQNLDQPPADTLPFLRPYRRITVATVSA